MTTPPDNVREFYEARSVKMTGNVYEIVGVGKEFDQLPQHEDYIPVPEPALAAYGFYVVNVQDRDNGSVYLFRADANGIPTFGIITTSDGGDYWFEVYGESGDLLGAARMKGSFIIWRDRDAIRGATWEDDWQELNAAILKLSQE